MPSRLRPGRLLRLLLVSPLSRGAVAGSMAAASRPGDGGSHMNTTIEDRLEQANDRLRVELADMQSQLDDLTETLQSRDREVSLLGRELEQAQRDAAVLRCRDRIDSISRLAVLVGRYGHGNVSDAEDVIADMADQAVSDLVDQLKGGA